MNEKQIMNSSVMTVPGFVSLREAAEIMDQDNGCRSDYGEYS